MVIFLVILTLVGASYAGGVSGIKNGLLAIITGILFDYLVMYLMNRPWHFPDGALITGIIVGGILSPATPWFYVMMTTIIALLSKHLLKDKRRPLLNPAAVGLFISAILFSTGESWWIGLSMIPSWCAIIMILFGMFIASRINKLPLVFAFLATYMIFFLIAGILNSAGAGDVLRTPYINAALFLSFFMLTDPPTSPAKYREQILFGCIVSMVSCAAFLLVSRLTYLFIGLFISNLLKLAASKMNRAPIHGAARR
ncbi:RnfABCDGE type electron transport complex subunit D [Sporolactobacillus sp. CPB3-1]|uniref:RnfABCDGE type electron transport complex subunit D n=1 Tax=Sporolactobacillus mangiferae TaxID=2940498 RepID=A0ABT0M6T1_9BACL|nr:RnfABCDGE type electron transport complex subunit D [Sporolactobacillus mangiferae]